MIPWSLIWGVGKWVAVAAAAGLFYLKVTSDAYDRGFSARDTEAREYMARAEARLSERMRKDEGLSDSEIDCQLRRLRNPKAEC